jgi:translocation protein SEC63
MGRLEYDDNGFAYFGLGLGVSFLVPLTALLALQLMRPAGSGDASGASGGVSRARTAVERRKLAQVEKEESVRARLTRGFVVKAALVLLGWLFVLYLYSFTGQGQGDIAQFDPWEIMSVPEGALEDAAIQKAVKSAYRKLSLTYHPDRNVGKDVNEQATARLMFERVQKAHEILTDPDAYARFQSTGSPDGSKNMEVSIGLPKFLLEKQNHNLVLVVYLLVLVVVTPITVGSWYSQSKLFGDKLILNDTYNIFTLLLDKTTKLEQMPEVLALSAEFRALPPLEEADERALAALEERLKREGLMPREPSPKVHQRGFFQRWPGCARANVLIHAYLNRVELSGALARDLEFILRKSKMLVDAMNEAVLLQSRHVRQISDILRFEQLLSQALWLRDSPYQQLPHVGKTEVQQALLSNASLVRTLHTPERLGRLTGGMTAEQKDDVQAAAKLLPDVTVTVTIGTVAEENADGSLQFEDFACEGDIVTAHVELERRHELGPVHAPLLPFVKDETWFVLFCKKGDPNVLMQAKLTGSAATMRERITFPSRNFIKPGSHQFEFHVISTGYIGFDQVAKAELTLREENLVQLVELHPDDVALDKMPTLFEETFGVQAVSDDSDFADSDDDKNDKDKDGAEGKPVARRKSAGSQGSAKSEPGLDKEEEGAEGKPVARRKSAGSQGSAKSEPGLEKEEEDDQDMGEDAEKKKDK